MDAPTFPVRFPKPQTKEVVLIRLPDGSIVARTREELEQAKQGTSPQGGAR